MNIESSPYNGSRIKHNIPVDFSEISEIQVRCRKLGNEILECQYWLDDLSNHRHEDYLNRRTQCEEKRMEFKNLKNLKMILRENTAT